MRGLGLDRVEQPDHARQHVPARLGEHAPQVVLGALPEALALAVRERAAVPCERIADDERVGAPGERHAFQRALDAEDVVERVLERGAPGALGVDERAVHVEQPDQRRCRKGHGGQA